MLQYKIPQNVEVEDTIIGPITMKQLIILAIGGGTAYLFYISLAKTYFFEVWGPPVLFFSLSSIAIAFVEIRGIRFVKWFLLMMESLMLPRKRVWDKRQSTQLLFQHIAPQQKASEKPKENDLIAEKQRSASHLEELTKMLDMSSAIDEKEKSPVGVAKDHDLAASAITDGDKDRHEARLKNEQQNEKISAIRADSLPISLAQINTLEKPKIPDSHKEALAKVNS